MSSGGGGSVCWVSGKAGKAEAADGAAPPQSARTERQLATPPTLATGASLAAEPPNGIMGGFGSGGAQMLTTGVALTRVSDAPRGS